MHLAARDLGAEPYSPPARAAAREVLIVATPGRKRVGMLVDRLARSGLIQTSGDSFAKNGDHVFAVQKWIGRLISRPAKKLLTQMLKVTDPEDPNYVDAALVGLDMLARLPRRKERQFEILAYTECGLCSMEVLVKESAGLTPWDVKALEGWTIYTSYVRATHQFLKYHGVKADVVFLDGKEEFAVRDRKKEACVCMYESGGTARKAGLVRHATVMSSQFVVVARKTGNADKLRSFAEALRQN